MDSAIATIPTSIAEWVDVKTSQATQTFATLDEARAATSCPTNPKNFRLRSKRFAESPTREGS